MLSSDMNENNIRFSSGPTKPMRQSLLETKRSCYTSHYRMNSSHYRMNTIYCRLYYSTIFYRTATFLGTPGRFFKPWLKKSLCPRVWMPKVWQNEHRAPTARLISSLEGSELLQISKPETCPMRFPWPICPVRQAWSNQPPIGWVPRLSGPSQWGPRLPQTTAKCKASSGEFKPWETLIWSNMYIYIYYILCFIYIDYIYIHQHTVNIPRQPSHNMFTTYSTSSCSLADWHKEDLEHLGSHL